MIDPNRVKTILMETLQGGDGEIVEVPEDCRLVNGVMNRFAISITKLEPHRREVVDMLRQLDDSFMDDGGQGMSLMSMVATSDGQLWGEQYHADQLYVLANALGLAQYTLPKEMWGILPGSMPYITVMRSRFDG